MEAREQVVQDASRSRRICALSTCTCRLAKTRGPRQARARLFDKAGLALDPTIPYAWQEPGGVIELPAMCAMVGSMCEGLCIAPMICMPVCLHSRSTRAWGLPVVMHLSNDHAKDGCCRGQCLDPVWSKYPNALLSHRLRLHHDTSFSLNFTALSPILILHRRCLCRSDMRNGLEETARVLASIDEELRLRNAYLVAENRMLRQQIPGRVQLADNDRKALAELGQQLGKKALEEIATIAKPDTILAWHRTLADQQVDASEPHTCVGRPRIGKEIEALVVRMARENRRGGMIVLWAPSPTWAIVSATRQWGTF